MVAVSGAFSLQEPNTQAERDGLAFMREEEKLAFDVYTVLAQKWGSRPFGNIAQAEKTHMDAVKVLLTRYGIDDPAAKTKPGEFKDPTLQKLYNDLVKTGSTSRIAALRVGAKIEDLDIYDLGRMLKQNPRSDIKAVYENLERGSRNHLRAFVNGLRSAGADYKPEHITQQEFDKIIASPTERGGGKGRGPRGQG